MLHVCIGGMQSLFCCILVVIFIQTFNFIQKIPRYVLTKVLGGHSVKFPLQYIFNFRQYGIFSRYDSFGDIPGHGATVNLDRQVLWTLKSFLVLVGASFTVRYWIRIKVWSGTPMDKSRQLSVTFTDWFASSVLGAIAVVTVSYNFPAGEKQVVRCPDSFIKYVPRYYFQICPSIQVLISDILSAGHLDNINWEFFVRTVKYFFGFLASHNRFSLVYKFNNIPISRFARPFLQSVYGGYFFGCRDFFPQSSCLQISTSFCFHISNACTVLKFKIFRIWHERVRFRIILRSFFSFFTISKRFNNPMHEEQCCMCV